MFGNNIIALTFVIQGSEYFFGFLFTKYKRDNGTKSSYGMVVARYYKYREQPCYN